MSVPVQSTFVFYSKTEIESGPAEQVALVTKSNEDYTLNLTIFNETTVICKSGVAYDENSGPGTWRFM